MKRLQSCFVFILFAFCILACSMNAALGQDVALNDPSSNAAESGTLSSDTSDSSSLPIESGNPAYDGDSDTPAEPEEVLVDDTAPTPDSSSDPAPVPNGDSSPAPTDTPEESSDSTSTDSEGLSGPAIAAIIGGSAAVLVIGAIAVRALTKPNQVGVQRETRSKPLTMKERRDILLRK